jgi:hypothetical protein
MDVRGEVLFGSLYVQSPKILNIFRLNLVFGVYTEHFLASFMLLCICHVIRGHSIKLKKKLLQLQDT